MVPGYSVLRCARTPDLIVPGGSSIEGPATAPSATVVASVGPATAQSASTQPIRYRMLDCHLHLVDFLQRTDGVKAALAAMDQVRRGRGDRQWDAAGEGVAATASDCGRSITWRMIHAATGTLPPTSWWRGRCNRCRRTSSSRFHPTICGFNGADRNALDHVKRMIDWYPGFWQGIGEVMTRHDDLTALTYGEPARADNLALSRVFTFAGEHDLPVFLHSNIGSVWKHEPIYLAEVETAVRDHPKTRFVWCHAGISRRIVIPTLTRGPGCPAGQIPQPARGRVVGGL